MKNGHGFHSYSILFHFTLSNSFFFFLIFSSSTSCFFLSISLFLLQRIELKDFFNNWILMAGKRQPNRDKISLFCHNKVQKPYLTRYSVNKFYKVSKNRKKRKILILNVVIIQKLLENNNYTE